MDKPIKINIRGNEYYIKSDENDIDNISRIEEYVNEKLKEISESIEGLSERKTVILTAVYIASEYFQVLKERDALQKKIAEKSESLILSINDNLR